ncbi:unnamed protein product, partial [Symbiodinium necroappetens]
VLQEANPEGKSRDARDHEPVFWISIEFSQTQIAFLDRMGQVGFKVVDDFACRERGYANPGSMYECYRFEKAPPLWI